MQNKHCNYIESTSWENWIFILTFSTHFSFSICNWNPQVCLFSTQEGSEQIFAECGEINTAIYLLLHFIFLMVFFSILQQNNLLRSSSWSKGSSVLTTLDTLSLSSLLCLKAVGSSLQIIYTVMQYSRQRKLLHSQIAPLAVIFLSHFFVFFT